MRRLTSEERRERKAWKAEAKVPGTFADKFAKRRAAVLAMQDIRSDQERKR